MIIGVGKGEIVCNVGKVFERAATLLEVLVLDDLDGKVVVKLDGEAGS